MLNVPGTNVIEPIELGENTFAVNLNRSDLGEMLKNAKATDKIEWNIDTSCSCFGDNGRRACIRQVREKIRNTFCIRVFYAGYSFAVYERGDRRGRRDYN